jgi:hypothetical protein
LAFIQNRVTSGKLQDRTKLNLDVRGGKAAGFEARRHRLGGLNRVANGN